MINSYLTEAANKLSVCHSHLNLILILANAFIVTAPDMQFRRHEMGYNPSVFSMSPDLFGIRTNPNALLTHWQAT